MADDSQWQEVVLPTSVAPMGCGCPGSSVLHYSELGEWRLYVVSTPRHGLGPVMQYDDGSPAMLPDMQDHVRWSVAYRGREVAQGDLSSVDDAKKVCLRVVAAFEGVELAAPPEAFPGMHSH